MQGILMHTTEGSYASEDEVRAIQTPEGTPTWTPVPHGDVIDLTVGLLKEYGLEVESQIHGLWREGARYFSAIALKTVEGAEYTTIVGLRNSHDKEFPIGLAVGAGVFVCDNMSFSSEIVVTRKHTPNVIKDMPRLMHDAVGRIGGLRQLQDQRIEAYQNTTLDEAAVHDMLIRSVDARIIANAKVPRVLKEWRNPSHVEFAPRTAWSLFNSYTEILKGSALIDLPNRTTRLHGMMDSVAGLLSPGNDDVAVAI